MVDSGRSPQGATERVTDASNEEKAGRPFEAVGQEGTDTALYRRSKEVDERNGFELDHLRRESGHHTA